VDYVIRFIAGGVVVSLFALLGDLLRPKSFAGLFGAAPSVALATLSLAFWKEGAAYVATEGRSMVLGSLALAFYSVGVCQLMVRMRASALLATTCTTALWLAAAFSLKQIVVG
jgi:hypothetical protein